MYYTHTLHTLNKAISNVDKTITDYKDVKQKSFLEIPVPLSLTMKSLSACRPADTRHPDRLPGSRPFTHLAVLGWFWSGRCGISHHLLSMQQDDTILLHTEPTPTLQTDQGVLQGPYPVLRGGGKALSMLTRTFYLLTLDQICCVIVVGSVLKNR